MDALKLKNKNCAAAEYDHQSKTFKTLNSQQSNS